MSLPKPIKRDIAMPNEPDFLALAVELICFVQEGRWYNGKVNTKMAEAVAERLQWGPGTAWWPSDQRLCREWVAERQKRAVVTPMVLKLPELPRPLKLPDLPRTVPVPSLPKLPGVVLPRLK